MIVVGDKIQCIKHCDLSTVITTPHGSYLLGGCIYNLIGLMMQLINIKYVRSMKRDKRCKCIECDGHTLCWCFLYVSTMRTELGVDTELHGVS
jgi:hypothetical protein